MQLQDHPTVRGLAASPRSEGDPLDSAGLRQLALDCGADDVGLVEIARPGLDAQRAELLRNYPWTRTVLGFVVRMAREPLRGAPRSVANLEFHRAGHEVDVIAASIVAGLERRSIRAVNPSMGFPMEMTQSSGFAPWIVSHKPIAVEAGLGHMGIHRNLIHPKFGNFVLLGTVLIEAEVADYDHPIDYNPCLECKLCVAACPVGAIGPDGSFNFSACFTHNYREFLGGFTDWVEQIADARDALDYRQRIHETETNSMWQSLSHGANYKSAYCMAVCPAGEDVIGPYLKDKARHLKEIVRPLQERSEPVYVVEGSDAEEVARRKFKNKTVKTVGNGLRPRNIAGLLNFMPYVFQANRSRGVERDFSFHVYRRGRTPSDHHHQEPDDCDRRRLGRQGRSPRHRRCQDLARLPRERKEPPRGPAPAKDSYQGRSPAASCLRQMFSFSTRASQARGSRSPILPAGAAAGALPEERPRHGKDQVAGQTRPHGNGECNPRREDLPLRFREGK
jgi:Fe-S-cluster-containing hydrogenase component 2